MAKPYPPPRKRKKGIGKIGKRKKHHGQARLRDRFGFFSSEYDDAITQIQSGAAQVLYKPSNNRTHFRVKVGDDFARAVYDKKRKLIVTFMPMEWSSLPRSNP